MRHATRTICAVFLCLTGLQVLAAQTDDATSQLFELVDNGGCDHTSLTGQSWTLTSEAVGTHGELLSGDVIDIDLTGDAKRPNRRSDVEIIRNGIPWISSSGWTGQCVHEGNQGLWIVSGEVEIDGCLHELAIGRLSHDDSLTMTIEVIFQNSPDETDAHCQHILPNHPGHVHGGGNGDGD